MNSSQIIIDRAKHDIRKDMSSEHFHDRYEIYYLIAGERYYFIDHQVYYVQPGDLIFVDRYALHKTRDTGIGRHERILIEFTEQFLQGMEDRVSHLIESLFVQGGRVIHLRLDEREQIQSLLEEVLEEYSGKQADYEMNIQLTLMKLLIRATRFVHQEHHVQGMPYTGSHPTLPGIIRYVNANFSSAALSLDQISEKFDISKFYFCRLFKQFTGYTFTQYVNLLKLREAQRLLRTSNQKIIDVSAKSGFDNVHHFCRVFKQVLHCTPSSYRKNR